MLKLHLFSSQTNLPPIYICVSLWQATFQAQFEDFHAWTVYASEQEFCITLRSLILVWWYRVEYDAYRTDLEALQSMPRDSSSGQKVEDAQKRYQAHKDKFDKLRADVMVKMQFLDENRVSIGKNMTVMTLIQTC